MFADDDDEVVVEEELVDDEDWEDGEDWDQVQHHSQRSKLKKFGDFLKLLKNTPCFGFFP